MLQGFGFTLNRNHINFDFAELVAKVESFVCWEVDDQLVVVGACVVGEVVNAGNGFGYLGHFFIPYRDSKSNVRGLRLALVMFCSSRIFLTPEVDSPKWFAMVANVAPLMYADTILSRAA
jgi:hypothetical protein